MGPAPCLQVARPRRRLPAPLSMGLGSPGAKERPRGLAPTALAGGVGHPWPPIPYPPDRLLG